MHDSVTLLHSKSWHNIVNQIYTNKNKNFQNSQYKKRKKERKKERKRERKKERKKRPKRLTEQASSEFKGSREPPIKETRAAGRVTEEEEKVHVYTWTRGVNTKITLKGCQTLDLSFSFFLESVKKLALINHTPYPSMPTFLHKRLPGTYFNLRLRT